MTLRHTKRCLGSSLVNTTSSAILWDIAYYPCNLEHSISDTDFSGPVWMILLDVTSARDIPTGIIYCKAIELANRARCHDFGLAAKSGHVRCRLLGSRGSGMFWSSGGVVVRRGLWIGQVFWQEFHEGFRGTKIGWAFGPQRSCILYMKEKCKEKYKQHQRNAVAAVTESGSKNKT
jgi:hypothetical protein